MSKENTNCDVIIKLYDASKTQIAHVVFFNDCELLLECKRVTVVRDGNRLYFHKGDSVKGSIKFSGNNSTLQLWKDYSKVRDLEGRYDLKYDKEHDLYYIDKQEKLNEYIHHVSRKGVKQLNHNPGNREKVELKGEQIVTAILKDRGKKAVETAQKQKKEDENSLVVKALMQLLKTQVKGNSEALSTIEVMEKFV